MPDVHHEIADILLHCEEKGIAPRYSVSPDSYREEERRFLRRSHPQRTEPVAYKAKGEEIFIVSDLHIAGGKNEAGVFKGTENFFADDSFGRFLNYAHRIRKTENALLIINGDIFDFLRVVEFPGRKKKVRWSKRVKNALKLNPLLQQVAPRRDVIDDQYERWGRELRKIGIEMTRQELEEGISKRERTYGLGTEDFKTIYKLMLIRDGHPVFFDALGHWLEQGHRLIIVKGNHDLELYWLQVRNYFRFLLAENITHHFKNKDLTEVLKTIVLPNITFIDDSVVIDDDFYVEHGHRYDKFTMVLDGPTLSDNPCQINIPFGSFFNRYLINRIELFYPFLDNVRPSGNVLPILIKENFPLAIKVLFQHLPFLLRMLSTKRRYMWYMIHSVLWFSLALIAPVVLLLIFSPAVFVSFFSIFSSLTSESKIFSLVLNQSKGLGLLIASYLLSRFAGWFQLEEPSSLDNDAEQRSEGTPYKIMTMGHTHNPGEYLFNNGCRFYNTGTWIPVIENSTADIREDKTFTFLHLVRNQKNELELGNGRFLERWNDDAGRADCQIVIERK